jgi:anti-sigma regulatory factor (Ser/Thr protein kinase)
MKSRTTFVIKNSLAELGGLLPRISEWCRENGVSEEITYEVKLLVDEVASNVIRHGYRDENEHTVSLDLALGNDELLIQVVDEGVHFDPLIIPPPDISKPVEERRPGGMGIHLVKNLTDRLDYRRENGKNCLTMRKNIRRG